MGFVIPILVIKKCYFDFQFFGNSMAVGFNWYRKKGHKELEDSEATEAFVSRVNALADSMNSSNASGAYRKGSKHETVSHMTCTVIANNLR